MTEYHVAKTGNDGTGDGSFGDPWLTIQYGYDQLTPGDTLYVRVGTYVEEIDMDTFGSSGNLITVTNYQNDVVTLDGEAGVGGLNDGLPNGTCAWTDPISGKCFVWEALIDMIADYNVWDGIDVYRSMGRGIGIENDAMYTEIKNASISYSRNAGIIAFQDSDQVTIDNVDVFRNGDFATYSRSAGFLDWPSAVSIRGDNVTVKNSIVRQNWCEGINYWLSPNGGTCIDNIVYDNYALQIYMDRAIDITVERNLVYFSTSSEFYRGGSPSSGIVINNETNTHLCDNLTISNNFILGCYSGIDQWATTYPVSDMAIINNTIVDCYSDGINLLGTSSQTNLRCKNNIVYQTTGDVIYVETSNGWTFSHNCWYGGGSVDGDAVSGDDVTTDPLLDRGDTEGPGELDAWHFKIVSGSSPCIGAALEDSDSPVDDYYGTTRSDDDMGGHEYGGGDIEVQAPLGTLALTGHVPIVIATGDIEIQIPLGALVLTGHAPTAIATEDVEIQTPLGTLVLTGHVPIVTAGIGVQVPLGVLVLTGQVPSITVTANQNVRVPLGALSLIGHVPVIAVAGSVEVQIPAGILVLTGYAPIVATTGAMNSFIVLDGHRYKCMHEDWRPKRSKSSSAQYTLSGNLDMTYGTVTSFEWEGNILAPVTPDDETYGDIDDLRATLAKRTPLSYRDYYGDEYTVHVIGPFTEESRSPMWDAVANEFRVDVRLAKI